MGGYDNGSIWWTGTTVSSDYPKCKIFDSGGAITISSDTSFTANTPYGPGTITYTPGTQTLPKEWYTEAVDTQYEMGTYNSIAVDSSGYPHISYFDWAYFDLKYAHFDGSNWEIVTVDGQDGYDVGQFSSLALDTDDRPHIAYRSNEGVKYAYLDSQGTWHTESVVDTIIGSPTIIYTEISLALDSTNTPHICFVSGENPSYTNPVMHYITKDSSGDWTAIEVVDTPTLTNDYFASLSIAVDSSNIPHIGYVRRSRAWYATRTSLSTWDTMQVGTDSTEYPAYKTDIAIDGLGNLHMSFMSGGLKYAYLNGSSVWQVSSVDIFSSSSFYDTSITIDYFDNPHIAYIASSNILKYAYYDGSQWNYETVGSCGSYAPTYVDIAVGPNNEPNISYYKNDTHDLYYAVLDSTVMPDPDSDDDGINDTIDGQVVPNTTNFIDESDFNSNNFTDIHLGGTTYGEIIDRQGLDVNIDDLSVFGVVINVEGDPLTYATINVCGIPYAFYGGDSGSMTCGSSTASILSGQPEAWLLENVTVLLPNGSISTIDELSVGEFIILNHPESLSPITIVENGVESQVPIGGSDSVSEQTGEIIVEIDIKPGSYPNCFNINDHGVIPVAILGSEAFDVTTVDISTIVFGGLEVRVRGNKGPLCHIEDVSGDPVVSQGLPDGFDDLVCQFEDDSSAWVSGNDEATITGTLLPEFGGSSITGSDSICIKPE